MEDKILKIQKNTLEKILKAQDLKELDRIFIALFGKKGELDLLPKEFSKLSSQERRKVGPLFNLAKHGLEQAIEKRRTEVKEENYKKLERETLTLRGDVWERNTPGHLHPIARLEKDIVNLFSKLGFALFNAPHIDNEEYNFELLNIPQGHPARDLWDTLYIDTKNLQAAPGELLLRTHTSNAQIRIMKEYKPPIRMMIIDRCFRYEAVDARHEHTLDQFEIVYIDKGVSMAHLQYLSEYFFQGILGKDIKARLRPKYYPFVEPGAGVDGLCIFCKGKGCQVCGGVGWLELAGAGMIHPQVLKNGGIDPNEYSGIAWGAGPERMAMLKYGVEDIRLFKNGDLRFLQKL